MIKNLEIYNFRCFEKTKILGFSRVNLIGGKNNSGKTALLEALYLNNSPRTESVMFSRRLRGESLKFVKELPQRAWDNLFFNQTKEEAIRISSECDDQTVNTLELTCDDSMEEFSKIWEDEEQEDKDIVDLRALLSTRESLRSTLHLNQIIDGKKHPLSSLFAHSRGIMAKDLKIPDIKIVNFIPTPLRSSPSALAQEYDKADLNNTANQVLEAIKILDASIEQVKTLTIGEPALYLKRKHQTLLPISLFGEAINKVVDFILRLVNDRQAILLIDEIENGIHHTNQRALWRMLFKLAVEFETQIFATTHSLEMIQAFNEVGLEEGNKGLGAYIELARNPRTNHITGINHNLETLAYALERNIGVRGEQRFNRREQK